MMRPATETPRPTAHAKTRHKPGRWLQPRRAFAFGVGLLLAALCSILLASAADAAPTPPPTPAPSHPTYEPGLEPTAPGLLPPKSPGASKPANPIDPDTGADGDGGKEQDGMSAKERAQAEKQEKARQVAADWQRRIAKYKADHRNGGVLSAFEVTDQYGNPVSAYRVFSDTGSWTDWDLKIEAFLVEMLLLGTKWFVSFACFLIAWSLSFKLAGLLLKPALVVSDALYTNVLVQIGLPGLCLTYAGVVAGWHLMFGRKARGWGEAAAALVVSALSITTLAAPPQMLLSEQHGAVGSARALAVDVAALILDNQDLDTKPSTVNSAEKGTGGWESPAARKLSRPITDALVDSFVVRPTMLLSYGQTFEGKCAKQFQESRIEQAVLDAWLDDALDSGEDAIRKHVPFIGGTLGDIGEGVTAGSDALIKEHLQAKGPVSKFEKACVKGGNAKSLKKASMDKVGGALFMLIAAFLVCLFITVLDGSFLYAQFCIAKEAMIAKAALVIGVVPGPGRTWLTSRATTVLRNLWLMVLAVGALAVLIVVITAIINAPEKDLPGGVTVRFVVIDITCISAFVYRKKLVLSAENLSLRARARIGSSIFGGGTPSHLGEHSPKRSMGRKLMIGGMMLGALAASGGAAGAAYGHARGSRMLAGRLVRGTGRMVGGTARAAVGTTRAAARGGLNLGKFGLKSTLGLPVYGPRAARRTGAAIAAVPGQVTGGVAGLRQRLSQVHQQYAQPVQNFTGEYRHNLRSVGRLLSGRRPGGPYTPPRPATTRSAPARRSAPAAFRPPRPTSVATPAAARRRPVPPRVPQPPASPAQAALQQRLHRIRNRQNTPPAPPAPRPAPARPPRPSRRGRRRRGGGQP
ncbi:hypothetical protein [Streptomyces sp. NBC_01361]|uniref:hypothetical protein n=1 Tax=Streptomyces sp. NBC_01361 TaxID=2903838 RepID=UPI002E30E6C8|nr:hypothetical protein [Streptomyces sp. NBC_01361]